MAATKSPYGRTVLVLGPELLLAERAVATIVVRARDEDPEAELSELEASRLDRGKIIEVTSASLFSAKRVVVITDAANLPSELADAVVDVAAAALPDLALVVMHSSAARGRSLVERLKASAEIIDCPTPKPWEAPAFVTAEAARLGSAVEPAAAQFLVDAVGHDLRALAAAVAQLVADGVEQTISVAQVRRYFGGRAEVTSFAVVDAALAGRAAVAMEQLRWAVSTGVAPVLVTSALASGLRGLGRLVTAPAGLRDNDLAREVGAPPWKLKSMRAQARGWDQRGLATALQAVAVADAEIKGAADDPEFALERLVLRVARSRRG